MIRTAKLDSLTIVALAALLATACDPSDGDDGMDPSVEGATDTGAGDDDDDEVPPGQTSGQTSGQTPGDTETEGEPEPDPTDGIEGEPQLEACDNAGDSRECPQGGTQFCDDLYGSGEAERVWGPCLTDIVCTPGESRSCFCDGEDGDSGGMCDIYETCGLYGGVPDWDTNQDEWGGCNTPLVLSFDGRPARMTPAAAATFDLDGIGGCITTDWPESSTPWLALDRDGNGSIDSGRELFGSGTRLADGRRAAHGFAALAELDDNGDGRIDVRDAGFGALVLWGDHDGDRRSTFAEMEPLARRQVLDIELSYRIERQCDERGNCGVERASFRYIDEHGAVRQGEVVDLHLACQ